MRKGTAIQSLTPMRDNNIKTKNEKEKKQAIKRKRERKAGKTDGLVLTGKKIVTGIGN